MNTIKFSRIREVKFPTRGTSESAGMDVYIPKLNDQMLLDFTILNPNIKIGGDKFTMGVGESILLPTGLKTNFDDYARSIGKKLMLAVNNKSGIASKNLVTKLAEIIDQDYQGEIFINIVNVGKEERSFSFGQEKSIAQLILQEYLAPEMVEVSEEELWKVETERGEGSRGSTDKK